MNRKEELIVGILKKELKDINRLLKSQEEQIESIRKNGFDKEIHKANRDPIWTGLHYTQGYCVGHAWITKKVISLLKLSDAKDVEALIAENKKIEKENQKRLREMFKEIKQKVKEKKKSSLNDVFGVWKGKKLSLDKIREKAWNRKNKK